tara:strand:+ start:862 stop:1968 length:1107 start_codon:yes stop_codon:yes gene_type:complete
MSDQFKYTTGLRNVGSYLAAGSPYVTASTVNQDTEQEIQFPRVTNNVTVKLDSAGLKSIAISGSIFAKTADEIYTDDGHDYSVTMWVSASNDLASNDQESVWSFTTGNARNLLKEKNNKWQFLIQDVGATQVALASPGNSVPSGWQFIACVAKDLGGSIIASLSLNAATSGGNFASQTKTTGADIDNTVGDTNFNIGPIASGRDDGAAIKVRDVILWDGALSTANVSTLYNSGQYYNPSQLTVFSKLVWIKDNFVTDAPQNHGTTGGVFSLQDSGSGDIFQISSDSPFGSSGGELRVHYRSTGSLPNVASNKHYWTLSSQDEEIKMNVKTKEIYLSAVNGDCDFSIQADMTNIPAARMYQHTGSGVDE